ncbi:MULTISPECIES: PRK06851 family protein [unclassified Paenibacillus]|uniref:PRK06851 family protein n=1 Tax=unclassified Paenibacillus TaxID=185978 RepID=UPI001AE28876|nr:MULTISPECIES: PRK06851 family protein [unclassified Paenibacillus]MBP1156683.1 hypothetical protein [Paenibacillus sp. PvP091]MBP1172579.1 hypothetical protein [Paenibacillus sp. PvR098]MBP2438959.1 hypothetical protein [Paenibacillus sp. PvP052]
MTGIVKNFYASGNTARGFANLFDSSLQGLERLFILQGGSATAKSGLIRTIGNQMVENGYDIWFIHCASDNDSLDGLIIPALRVGIVDGTAPRVIEPREPGTVVRYVTLGETGDTAQLAARQPEIENLNESIQQAHERAYAGFAEALRIHDEWETIYIANMNFQAADELTVEYIQLLYGNRKLERQSRVDHRFLGAATPKGAVDFVPNLTEGLKRYLIKGRAGSGKSTLLKKLAAAGIERGFDVEIYHCGFDPNSLDMVIVRELGFAIFDSTAPHEYYPDRDADEILDMYEHCIKPGTDEAHADAISDIKGRYAAQMKASIEDLAQAKSLQDELEQIYVHSTDFHRIDQIKEEVLQEIISLAAISE